MVKLYVSLIKKGLRTIEQVPEVWRVDVEKVLEEDSH